MPQPLSEVVSFLQSRRSRPAKTLKAPGPDRQEMTEILTMAARTPDHGKLEPWRFIVVEGAAMARLAEAAEGAARRAGLDADAATKARGQFDHQIRGLLVVAEARGAGAVFQSLGSVHQFVVCHVAIVHQCVSRFSRSI